MLHVDSAAASVDGDWDVTFVVDPHFVRLHHRAVVECMSRLLSRLLRVATTLRWSMRMPSLKSAERSAAAAAAAGDDARAECGATSFASVWHVGVWNGACAQLAKAASATTPIEALTFRQLLTTVSGVLDECRNESDPSPTERAACRTRPFSVGDDASPPSEPTPAHASHASSSSSSSSLLTSGTRHRQVVKEPTSAHCPLARPIEDSDLLCLLLL